MVDFHFLSIEASQKKTNITNRFGNRLFVLVSFTCFLCKSDRFEVICAFRLLNSGGNPFPVHGSMANKSDVTNRFGDGEFILAVCTCFIRKCDRFEAMRDFRSLNSGRNLFPVDGSIAEEKWLHHSIPDWQFS
jgi:uncharacterized membrane protein YbaN (DUF454 family)